MHLHVAELALDHTERVFDLGPDAGLEAFELVGQTVDRVSLVQQLAHAWVHGDVPVHAMASYFAAAHRNKRTVCVDVSEPKGRGMAMRIATGRRRASARWSADQADITALAGATAPDQLGDTSTLADPAVVERLVKDRLNT